MRGAAPGRGRRRASTNHDREGVETLLPAPSANLNGEEADLEAALAASVASGLTALEEDERIRAFIEVTGLPEYLARETLQAHQWHVQRAAGQYVPELLYIDPEKERIMQEAAAAEVIIPSSLVTC